MDFLALAQQCAPQVAPQTMAAIVRTESGFKPLAIGVNRGGRLERQPASVGEAVATAKWLISQGYNIDLGLAQINSDNLRRTGLSVEDAFDPCKNLAAGAFILQGNYRNARRKYANEQDVLRASLSAYNTGNFRSGFSNGYVSRVIHNARTVGVPAIVTGHAAMAVALPAAIPVAARPGKVVQAPREDKNDSWNVYQAAQSETRVF